MKKLMAILLCVAMLCGITACGSTGSSQSESTGMQDGTYTATKFGMMGDVVVTLTVEGGKITAVEAVGESETAGIGTLALEQLPAAIVEAQSADVDAVATATVTSDAIKAAAQACIDQAMGLVTEGDGEEIPTEADVIVVVAVPPVCRLLLPPVKQGLPLSFWKRPGIPAVRLLCRQATSIPPRRTPWKLWAATMIP